MNRSLRHFRTAFAHSWCSAMNKRARSALLPFGVLVVLAACSEDATPPSRSTPSLEVAPVPPSVISNTACPGCVFGPEVFRQDDPTKPIPTIGVTSNRLVRAGDPAADYLLVVQDDGDAATDAQVRYGDVIVKRGALLGSSIRELRVPIKLLAKTIYLGVTLWGKPGASITVSILGGAKVVGQGGATIIAAGGLAKIVIPAGALPQPTQISMVVLPPPASTPQGGGTFGQLITLEPSGVQFALPVILSTKVTGVVASGAPPGFFELLPDGLSMLLHEDVYYDAPSSTLSVALKHFSNQVIFFLPKFTAGSYTYRVVGSPSLSRSLVGAAPLTGAEVANETLRSFAVWGGPLAPAISFAGVSATQADFEIAFVNLGSNSPRAAGTTILCSGGIPLVTCGGNVLLRRIEVNDALVWYSAQDIETLVRAGTPLPEGLQPALEHEIGHTLGLQHYKAFQCSVVQTGGPNCTQPPVMGATAVAVPLALRCEDLSNLQGRYSTVDPSRCAMSVKKISHDPTSVAPSSTVPSSETPQVQVVDATDRGVAGVTVIFHDLSGGAVAGGAQVTDVNGYATVGSWTVGPLGTAFDLAAVIYGPGVKTITCDPNFGVRCQPITDFQKQVIFTAVTGPASPPATWSPVDSLSRPRAGMVVATVGNIMFAIGGYAGSTGTTPVPLAVVEAYDPSTNTWGFRSDIVKPCSTGGGSCGPAAANGAGVIGGKIYVSGGRDFWGPLSWLRIYDPSSDQWSSGADMPVASAGGVSGVINGKMYVTSFTDSAGGLGAAYFQVYDPATDSWTPLPSPPNGHYYGAGGAINDRLFLVGGSNKSGQDIATMDIYDPVSQTWSTGHSLPSPRSGHVAAVANGKLIVAGGYRAYYGYVSEVLAYDPQTDSWLSLPSLPPFRNAFGLGVIGTNIYVIGGGLGGTALFSDVLTLPAP